MMSLLMNLIDNALILLNAKELTNRFHVAVHLFGNRSKLDDVKMWLEHKMWHVSHLEVSVSLMFSPHFDMFCDLLLNRHSNIESICCT